MAEMAADKLDDEARRMNELLAGKTVKVIWRHRANEIVIEFADGTRLFVDNAGAGGLEFSITPERR